MAGTDEWRRKYVMRSAAVMPSVSRATASFHLRLSATTSKPRCESDVVLLGIHDLLGADDTKQGAAAQEVHGIDSTLALHDDEEPKVPAHHQTDANQW